MTSLKSGKIISKYPKELIVPNQNLEFIPIPENPNRLSRIDISENPIRTLENIPKINTLLEIIGNNTNIDSFYGVSEQPHLTTLSLINTPISQNPYFKMMASIVFGHSLKFVNNEALTIKDLDDQLRYGPTLRKYLFEGFVINTLEPTIQLYNPSNDITETVNFKPSRSFLDPVKEEEDINDIVLSAFKPKQNKQRRDPIDILNYHKKALAKFQSNYTGRKVPFPSPQQDINLYDIQQKSNHTDTESFMLNEESFHGKEFLDSDSIGN